MRPTMHDHCKRPRIYKCAVRGCIYVCVYMHICVLYCTCVCAHATQGHTHVRSHALVSVLGQWKSQLCARLCATRSPLSPSDTSSTLKARSQKGIETFGVTGRSRHTFQERDITREALEHLARRTEKKSGLEKMWAVVSKKKQRINIVSSHMFLRRIFEPRLSH